MKKVKPIIVRSTEQLGAVLGLSEAEMREVSLRNRLVGQIIKALGESGMTHANAAKLAGTSRSRLTAIVNGGTVDVSTDLLLRILMALGYEARVTFKRVRAA